MIGGLGDDYIDGGPERQDSAPNISICPLGKLNKLKIIILRAPTIKVVYRACAQSVRLRTDAFAAEDTSEKSGNTNVKRGDMKLSRWARLKALVFNN